MRSQDVLPIPLPFLYLYLHLSLSLNNWGEPKRAPHLSLIRENRCTYVCMYVCVYVAIRRPRAYHAIAHVQAS